MAIDIGTLSFLVGVIDFLQVFAFLLQYLITRTYRGIGWWALGSALAALGFALFLLRVAFPQAAVIVLCANTLLVLGPMLIYVGITRFFEKKENRGICIAIFLAYLLFFTYFTLVRDSYAGRTVAISFTITAINFLTAHGLFFRKTRSVRASANFNALIVLGDGCFFAFRAIASLFMKPVGGFFTPTAMQTAMFMVSLVYGILLTLGLIIMVNQRLSADSREAKERFELLFNTSPDAVLISRLPDGLIIHVNDGFTRLTGYTRGEIIGRTAPDVVLWNNPTSRHEFLSDITGKGFCENMEAAFRRKDGRVFTGMISAKSFLLEGTPSIISVTRDITQRKKAEEALEDEKQRLQRTLDEVKTLRGILPICANCKKIRDDTGYWSQVEKYVADHSEAEFSHSICPDCMKKLYPQFMQDKAK